MQPPSMLGAGGAHGVSGVTACLSSPPVAGLADHMNHQQLHFSSQFDQGNQPHNQAMDDFIEQMFSMPSWPEVAGGKAPWECNNNVATNANNHNNPNSQTQKLFTMSLMPPGMGTQGLASQENDDYGADSNMQYSFDESLLASRLRQHHLSGNNSAPNQASSQGGITESTSPGRSMVLQLSTGNASASQLLASIGSSVMTRSPSSGGSSGSEGGMIPLPLSLGQGKSCDGTPNEAHLLGERSREVDVEASFKTANAARDSSPGGMFTTFCGTPVGPSRTGRPIAQQFHPQHGQAPMQSYGGMPQPQHQAPQVPSAVAAPTRPRVRARRGQATDPHSIAERLRRERIAERMKALQELVPNSNKTDKASMLDEIIDYVKFLQLQVKVLSMSRLGGAAAVAPLVADIPSEGGGSTPQAASLGRSNGSQNSSQDGLALTERQVAKLMEEDMGSAMQYLQGKGLCLMPISLATAISSSGASRSQSSPLQGLLASNATDRQIAETANSVLSSSPMNVQATISSPEAENASRVGNGPRIKESREAKANGLGPSHPKKEDEPQRLTTTGHRDPRT